MNTKLLLNAGLAAVAALAGALAATEAADILPGSWLAYPIVGLIYGALRVGVGYIAVRLQKPIPVDA